MLLTGALFTLPYLFMPLLIRYFTTRFSSRNTITFSLLAQFLLMGAGTVVLALVTGGSIAFPGVILLLIMVILAGMIYSSYRSALRIYIAETVAKNRFPRAGAVTEGTTWAGIIAGVAGAGIAAELPEDWPWWCDTGNQAVKAEMKKDPRWDDWVKRCGESKK